jgi:hypothetical protein
LYNTVFVEDDIQKAYDDVQNAKSFCDNIPGDADEDLFNAAAYNLKSAQHMLNYSLKQLKRNI